VKVKEKEDFMKIAIIGVGYVGLVTGSCFAEMGVNVVGVDIDKQKIDKLNNNIIPIYEPGLAEMIERNRNENRLIFTTNLEEHIDDCKIVFIAVGTPPNEDGSADLQHVLAVAKQIGQLINNYTIIVVKSTVPIGTSFKVKNVIQNELEKRNLSSEVDFDIVSNPEFLKEGDAIKDFMSPDRVVIGFETEKAKNVMEQLYKPFTLNNYRILFMDIASAEMTKYASNAMLATRISFMNEIAGLCELVGADINNVRRGMGSDKRIGNKFLYAGCGYGGSCFPKDVKALINIGKEYNYPMHVVNAVDSVNNKQKLILVDKILKEFDNNIKDKTIAIWGLSFKPETDDIREAPSIVIIKELIKNKAKVVVYDPMAMDLVRNIFGNKIEYADDMYEMLNDVDSLVLVTEWKNFRIPNWKIIKSKMRGNLIFDGRNIYDKDEVLSYGLRYIGIGR
jgi:UDPglucose 6-dehydrogenase